MSKPNEKERAERTALAVKFLRASDYQTRSVLGTGYSRMFLAFLLIILAWWLTSCATTTNPDLYSSANGNRMTADAAYQLARVQESFLSATAQAPITNITETAAALIVVQTRNSIDQTSTAVLWTATPTLTPSITPTSTPNITQTLDATILHSQETQTALDLKRKETANDFYAILPGISFVLVAGALILGLVWVARRERYKPAAVDARGNILPVIDYVEGTVTDPDRMPNYRGHMHDEIFKQWVIRWMNLPPLLPEVTAKRQDDTTQRDQLLDLATRGLPQLPDGKREIKRQAGQEMMKQISVSNLESRFKILDGSTNNLDVIDGEIIQVLDEDWKEAERR